MKIKIFLCLHPVSNNKEDTDNQANSNSYFSSSIITENFQTKLQTQSEIYLTYFYSFFK